MRKFIKFYANMPQTDGWFEAVEGMPGSKASNYSFKNALYRSFLSDFGSLQRGDGYGEGRRVYVGTRVYDPPYTRVLMQAKSDMPELLQNALK